MKKPAFILAFLLVIIQLPALAADPYDWLHVSGCEEWITMRAMPSKGAESIARIPLGAIVTYISDANEEFFEIQYAGMRGYALRAYLAEYSPETGFGPEQYSSVMYLRGNNMPLHSDPEMEGEPIAIMSKGEKVACFGKMGGDDSDIAFVRYGEMTGYASLSGLSFLHDWSTPTISGAVMIIPGEDGGIITQNIICSSVTKTGEVIDVPYSEEQVKFHLSEIAAMLDRAEPGTAGQCPVGAQLILQMEEGLENWRLRFMMPLDGCGILIAENETVFALDERDTERLWQIFGDAWKDGAVCSE